MQGVTAAGFSYCTPIQAQALPIALAGRDVAGQAQTGTGKTAAFLIALYQALLTRPAPANRAPTSIRALIVAPTRELAVQIHHDALILGAHTGLKHLVVFGGIDYDKQRQQLGEGCDVLIGTPGRLIDYFKQHVFDMRHAQVLVLDEADRMFDLGFIADIRYILRRLPHPERRLSMLFSATLSHRVLELAYEHMNNPELVRIEPDKLTVDQVRQIIYYPAMEEKVPLLIGLLHQSEAVRTMVFVNTRRMAERLESILKANKLRGAGAVRRRAAEQAAAVPARLPRWQARRADRDRRRLARAAYSRRQPRVQLRPAAGCPRLRTPHRPHRARRRRGRRHQLCLRGIRGLAAGDRGLPRAQDPFRPDHPRPAGRGGGGRQRPAPLSPSAARRRPPSRAAAPRRQECAGRPQRTRPPPLTACGTTLHHAGRQGWKHGTPPGARLSLAQGTVAAGSPSRPQAHFNIVGHLSFMAEIEDNVDRELFRNMEKLRQLRIEHRDLDEVISRLTLDLHVNELQLKRLKKRKLMLKDQIARLESQLIPDLNA